MKYVAAYLLAALNGESPTKKAVKKILTSINATIDNAQFDKVFSELDGKNIEDVIKEGMGLLASVPSGGDTCGAPEAKKEDVKADVAESSSDDDMGFDLFG